MLEITTANLAWQVHPDHPELLDEILDWYDAAAVQADHLTSVRAANADAVDQLAIWPNPHCRKGFGSEPPTRSVRPRQCVPIGMRGIRRVSPKVASPVSVKPAATCTSWCRLPTGRWPRQPSSGSTKPPTAEVEPVGTHPQYRRKGLGSALLMHGMQLARAAGTDRMFDTCLGAAAYPEAKHLYAGVGFRALTRELPHVKRASTLKTRGEIAKNSGAGSE